MNIFVSKSGAIILPHLNHVLKSYYYTSGLSAFAYNHLGEPLSAYAPNPHEILNPLMDALAQKELLSLIHSQSLEPLDSLVYELTEDVVCLVAPVMADNQLLVFLVSQPFSLHALDSQEKKHLHQWLSDFLKGPLDYRYASSLPQIHSNRLSYLGQLFFHLMSNGIYVGQQHFEPKQKMEETRWGKILPVDALYQAEGFLDFASVKQICHYFTLKDYAKAMEVYQLMKTFHPLPDHSQCPFKMLKYRLMAMNTLMAAYLSEHFSSWQVTLNKLSYEALLALDQCEDYSHLLHFGESLIEGYWQLIAGKERLHFSNYVEGALHFIHQNYHTGIKLSDAAAHVHINETYLSSQFKKECGLSFTQYLNQYRIEQAMALLENSALSMTDIAMGVGFESTNYFSIVFKKYTGHTPSQYRAHDSGKLRDLK